MSYSVLIRVHQWINSSSLRLRVLWHADAVGGLLRFVAAIVLLHSCA
jgi:hypothetical protein